MFRERFINEGFNVDFDVIVCLVNVNSIIHVEVSLLFNWDRELVVNKIHEHI